MSIIISPLFTDARGALGGVVIYKACGQVRMRTKPFSFRDKKATSRLHNGRNLRIVSGCIAYLPPFLPAPGV